MKAEYCAICEYRILDPVWEERQILKVDENLDSGIELKHLNCNFHEVKWEPRSHAWHAAHNITDAAMHLDALGHRYQSFRGEAGNLIAMLLRHHNQLLVAAGLGDKQMNPFIVGIERNS